MALLSDLLTTCSRLRSLFVVSVGIRRFYATIGSLVVLVRQVCVGWMREFSRSVSHLSALCRSVSCWGASVLQGRGSSGRHVVLLGSCASGVNRHLV